MAVHEFLAARLRRSSGIKEGRKTWARTGEEKRSDDSLKLLCSQERYFANKLERHQVIASNAPSQSLNNATTKWRRIFLSKRTCSKKQQEIILKENKKGFGSCWNLRPQSNPGRPLSQRIIVERSAIGTDRYASGPELLK